MGYFGGSSQTPELFLQNNFIVVAANGTVGRPTYSYINDSDTGMWTDSANRIAFSTGGVLRLTISNALVEPHGDNAMGLGSSARRWIDVWAVDTTINSSDAREKKFIKALRFDSIEFLHALPASQFKRRGRSRWHTGFTAQNIKKALDLMSIDLAVYVEPKNGDPLGMRVGELVPVLWDATQKIEARLQVTEKLLKQLDNPNDKNTDSQ